MVQITEMLDSDGAAPADEAALFAELLEQMTSDLPDEIKEPIVQGLRRNRSAQSRGTADSTATARLVQVSTTRRLLRTLSSFYATSLRTALAFNERGAFCSGRRQRTPNCMSRCFTRAL
jgi:hypothetical protein